MDALAADEIFLFEGFRLDRRAGGLFMPDPNGIPVPVAIGSRALDLLTLLVRRHGDLVSKDEIMAVVWPEMIVEDSNLPTQISALRRVLDNGRSNGSCIQTVAGRGYRFVAAVMHSAVAEPLVALSKAPEEIADLPASSPPIAVPRRLNRVLIAVAAALTALVIAVGAWWLWPTTQLSPVATSIPALLAAPRLSIVVLPFANFSNDPDQLYFADGISDDLTTYLSRITGMFVIARNTAFTYRNQSVDAKQIGRELGVRYLEGGVQRSGDQVRINAQLIDTESGAHLWAERFDGDTADLFGLQNEITSRIAIALNIELVGAEAARPTDHPDARDYILRGRAALLKPNSRDAYEKAISLFEHALTLDPLSAEAQSRLAAALAGRVLDLMSDSRNADLERANKLSEQALSASPRRPLAHWAKGQVLRARHRFADAIPEYETVLASDRNWVTAFFALGQSKLYAGLIDKTIPLVERAIRLSPRDHALGIWYSQIGFVHLLQSSANEAILWLERARNANPELSYVHAWLAAAFGLAGETERAAEELAEARRLSGEGRWSTIAGMRAGIGSWGCRRSVP
jgi:adenylate cyclase